MSPLERLCGEPLIIRLMKTSTFSLRVRKSQNRERLLAKMAAMRAAKERKRAERVAGLPPLPVITGRHCYTFTVVNRLTGTMHTVDMYVSAARVNSYRVTVDGQPWRDPISMTRTLAAIRRKMPPFRRKTDS